MKKIAVVFALAFIFAGCANDDDILVIGDRFFITQVSDVFVNLHEHMGRTIRHEGLFRTVDWFPTPDNSFVVYRYTMSCCGEEPIGFEVFLPAGMSPFADYAWVQVTGVVERSHGFPAIRATSIVEMPDIGVVFVWR